MNGKKKMKRLAIAAAVVVLLTCALLIVRKKSAEYEEAQTVQKEMIIDLTADQIKSIRYTTELGETLEFVKVEGQWTSTTNPDVKLDQTKVGTLASSVTGCGIAHTIENAGALEQYGLAEPLMTLSVTDMDGNETALDIGITNEQTLDVYCLRGGDQSTVYAVSTGLTVDLAWTIEDYIDDSEDGTDSAVSGAEEIAVSGAEETAAGN